MCGAFSSSTHKDSGASSSMEMEKLHDVVLVPGWDGRLDPKSGECTTACWVFSVATLLV